MRVLSPCQLTTRDFSILQSQLERNDLFGDPILPLIRDKLSSAGVVFPEDIDPRIVTLNSRVVFRVNHGPPDTRVVVHTRENTLVGVTIPIMIPRGLALLGMAEGQHATIHGPDHPDLIVVDEVAFQPEAARRSVAESTSCDRRPPEVHSDSRWSRNTMSASGSGVVHLAARRFVRSQGNPRDGVRGPGRSAT